MNSRSCHVCSRPHDLALRWRKGAKGVPFLPQVLPPACSSANFRNERKPTSVRWPIRRASIETVKLLCRGICLPFKPSIADVQARKLTLVNTSPVGVSQYPFTACCGVALGWFRCAFVSGHHRAASLKLPMNHVLMTTGTTGVPHCLQRGNPGARQARWRRRATMRGEQLSRTGENVLVIEECVSHKVCQNDRKLNCYSIFET